jgi:hypothetical protein
MSPEIEDIKVVRSQGLRDVGPDRRARVRRRLGRMHCLDARIRRFRLDTDRSLLKDFEPQGKSDQTGNFFAQRILVSRNWCHRLGQVHFHQTRIVGRSLLHQLRMYASWEGIMVDWRAAYRGSWNKEDNKVTDDCITTIRLNSHSQRDAVSQPDTCASRLERAPHQH